MRRKRRVEDESAAFVTSRAVTRYVQLILGQTVEGVFDSPAAQALAHCDAVGRALRDVRAEIYTAGVKLAVSMRLPLVDNGSFTAVIDPVTGRILTINLPRSRKHRRARLLSDRELMRKRKATIRKDKRRPKVIAPTNLRDEGQDNDC